MLQHASEARLGSRGIESAQQQARCIVCVARCIVCVARGIVCVARYILCITLHLAARLQQLRHLQNFDRGVELVDERLHRAVLRLLAT